MQTSCTPFFVLAVYHVLTYLFFTIRDTFHGAEPMGLLSPVRDIHPSGASVHRLNCVIPSPPSSGNRLDRITYSFHLANDAAGYARASTLQDTASKELPLLPCGSDEVQGVRFAQARRIGAEQ